MRLRWPSGKPRTACGEGKPAARSSPVGPAWRGALGGSISRRLSLALSLLVCLVLLVGAFSLLAARSIWKGHAEILKLHHHVEILENIHMTVHHLIFELETGLDARMALPPGALDQSRERINRLVDQFAAIHDWNSPEEAEERAIFAEIRKGATRLVSLVERFDRDISRGWNRDPVDLATMRGLVRSLPDWVAQMQQIHHEEASEVVRASGRAMRFMVATYLVLMVGGIGLVVLAHRHLRHAISLPLRALSGAARDIAGGNFARRVPVTSTDEIGDLSRSFNTMAQTIEEDQAALRRFSEELERKVGERTQELEEANRELRLAQARIVESEKAALIGQIAAGVAHEVRTPLNAMGINLQMIRRDRARERGPSCGACLEIVGAVEGEVERINRSLEGFVSFARLPEPQPRWMDANALIQQTFRLLGPEAKGVGVSLRFEAATDLPPFRADEDQLRQVLINLLLNAMQAMPDGGQIVIAVSRAPAEGDGGPGIRLRVQDTGSGIPAEPPPRIFEPFFTTKGNGLGLGLALVKRIVEAHGGSITCESRPGGGTQFDIVLPAQVAGET